MNVIPSWRKVGEDSIIVKFYNPVFPSGGRRPRVIWNCVEFVSVMIIIGIECNVVVCFDSGLCNLMDNPKA